MQGSPPSGALWETRARRRAIDPATLDTDGRAALAAWHAATAIEPQLMLMLIAPTADISSRWPAPLADLLLLPPAANPAETHRLAKQLAAAGWLQPTQSGRVVISLPPGPAPVLAETTRNAQRKGATALAICPAAGRSFVDPVLAAAFSAATFPRRP
jgi:hypothetical protein